MMKNIVAAFVVLTGMFTPLAHADDGDDTPYQFGQNQDLPGNQPFQPHCADVPISCGLSFNPDTGTWDRKSN